MTDSELISEIDCESLLLNLSKGNSLKDHEIDSIAKFVSYSQKLPKHKIPFDDLYSILTVLTKNNDKELSYLVNHFLNFQDSLIVGLALETLVCRWDCFEELHERLTQFLLGVPWDKDQDLKISALTCVSHLVSNDAFKNNSFYKQTYVTLVKEISEDKSTDYFAIDLCKDILQNSHLK